MEQDAPLKTAEDGFDDLLGGRGRRGESPSRRSRESDDRNVTENREITDAERLEMIRQQNFNSVLPNLPKIPGFHVCWLSTTHPNDSITNRIRKYGYQLIRTEDIPEFEFPSLKTGEYAGCIGVNEMVAAKIPQSLYEALMQEFHHLAPAREAEMIGNQAEHLREQARSEGGEIIEGDGMAELRRSAPARGVFTD